MLVRRLGECSAHAVRRAARAAVLPTRHAVIPRADARRHLSAASAPAIDERGLNSRDVFDTPPSSTFLKARLLSALTALRNPNGTGLDAEGAANILRAADALRAYPDVLQPHLHRISTELSRYYIANRASDEDLAMLQGLLAHACLAPRSVASQSVRVSTTNVYNIANRYAAWLVAECRTGSDERVNAILSTFEDQVRRLTEGGNDRLVVPYIAAWGILNARTGRTLPDDIFLVFPHDSTVTGWVSKNEWGDAAGEADVTAAIKALCDGKDDAVLPTTTDALVSRLFSLRNRGKIATLLQVWDNYAAELDNPASTHPLATPELRMEALAKFLSVVRSRSSQSASRTPNDREAASYIEKQARKRIPKPTPLPVLHALLSTAGPEDLEEGAGLPRDKTAVLGAAKEIWEAARAEGVIRDERAYSIYLGLLGRYHEGTEMFKIWDEMVGDTACRNLEASRAAEAPRKGSRKKGSKGDTKESKEGKTEASWPSTRTVNQVLSSGFAIGSHTAMMALALFRVAVDPKSPLGADLFTLNIALRFAGHCSDVKLMNEIISAASPLGLEPDIVTFTTLVQGLLRAGQPELARQTLDLMKSRGIEPNERMAAMLVADLSSTGSSDGLIRAEDVIRDMRQRGIRTSVPMWTSLVAGYFRGGWEVDAWSALDRMRSSGLRLNDIAYNIVLRQIFAAPGSEERAGRSFAHKGDRHRDRSHVGIAMKVFRHMQENKVPPTNDTYAILLSGLLRADGVVEMREVLETMDALGFKTNNRSLNETIRSARKALTRSPRMRRERY